MLPNIYSKRAELYSLKEEDFDELLAMYQEPDSNKFIPPLRDKTPAEQLAFLQLKITQNNANNGLGTWSIRTKTTQQLIGTANVNEFPALDFVHLGIHLSRSIWGEGYATEIMHALKDYAFNTLKLETVHAVVSLEHHASRRMLEKAGLLYKEDVLLGNEVVAIYALDRSVKK